MCKRHLPKCPIFQPLNSAKCFYFHSRALWEFAKKRLSTVRNVHGALSIFYQTPVCKVHFLFRILSLRKNNGIHCGRIFKRRKALVHYFPGWYFCSTHGNPKVLDISKELSCVLRQFLFRFFCRLCYCRAFRAC